MASDRYVAKGAPLTVRATLRELGLSKSEAARLARSVERLVDEVLPRPSKAKGIKRVAPPGKRNDRHRPLNSRAA